MPRETIGNATQGWQILTTAVAANADDLPYLAGHRTRLAELLSQVQNLVNQQAVLRASKQEITRQLQVAVDEAHTVAAFMRAGVREQYGREAEKLLEFGIRPFRGVRQEEEEPTPQPETAKPTAEAPSGTSDRPA